MKSPFAYSQWPWVAFEVSHAVCRCDYLTLTVSKDDHTKCGTCDKYQRWLLRQCEGCDKPFLKNFRHPNECLKNSACWECTQKFTEPCRCPSEGLYDTERGRTFIEIPYVPPAYILVTRKKVALDVAMTYEFDTDF